MKIFCGIIMAVVLFGACSASNPSTISGDSGITGTDNSLNPDNDAAQMLSSGEQHYPIAIADTGRENDFIISTPAGSTDKIVTDKITGLTWQFTISLGTFKWKEANDYCENLIYAGSGAWHLPTPHELASIVDYQKRNPAIYISIFSTVPYEDFWTASAYAGKTEGNQWAVSFINGNIHYLPADTYNRVRCVLINDTKVFTGARFDETVTSTGDVLILDNLTNLEWPKEYAENKTWQETGNYCDNLVYGGHSDWRMPGVNEVRSLLDYAVINPASNFPGIAPEWFWTSSPGPEALGVYLGEGDIASSEYGAANTRNIRCVRNKSNILKPDSSNDKNDTDFDDDADHYFSNIDNDNNLYPDSDTSACTVSDSITTPDPYYSAYYAVKAVGVINDSGGSSSPSPVLSSKFSLKLINFPSRKLYSSRLFYQAETLNDGSPAILLYSLGDPGTKLYGTMIITVLPVSELMSFKQNSITNINSGSNTQVSVIEEVSGTNYAKICLVAISVLDGTGQSFSGSGQICTGGNTDFSVGETMKFGTNIELTEDKNIIMQNMQVSSEYELCQCQDLTSGSLVQCP